MSEEDIEEIKERIEELPNTKRVIQELVEEKFKGESFRDKSGNFTLERCDKETLLEIVDYLINLSTLALVRLLS